jgi:hypothetical protein
MKYDILYNIVIFLRAIDTTITRISDINLVTHQ